MKKTNCAILNVIVTSLCLIALVGYFLLPLWKIKAKITFNEDLAELIFKNDNTEDDGKTDLENADDDILNLLVDELAKEEIELEFSVSIDTGLLISSALSSSKRQTEKFLHSVIDDLVSTLDEKTLDKLEDSLAKASVSAAIKVELKELAKDVDKEVEEVMDEIGVDDKYINDSTDAILDALDEENASVDSVTDVIIDVVKDVYDKYGNSSLADETFENLTPEGEQELREEIANVISSFANEDGTFDGDGLISSLIEKLLSENNSEDPEEEESALAPAQNLSFAVKKYLAPAKDSDDEDKPIDEKIADSLKESIDEDTIEIVRIVSIGIFAFVMFSAFWWIFLLIKILIKLAMRNPLIKLNSAISLGILPFMTFVLIPSIGVSLLKSPPAFIKNALGKEALSTIKTLFNGAIELSFSSSSIFAFICAIVLFIFGFYYSKQRRKIKRKLKEEKREQQRSGGLY